MVFCFDSLAGVCAGVVPHARAGLPDQQGVRALQQVHEQCQDCRFLRGHAHQEG